MNMQNLNWSISNKLMRLNSYITTERLVKKLKAMLLVMLVLSPSLVSAKMIKMEDNSYINETAIIGLNPKDDGSCDVIYSVGNGRRAEAIKISCENFIKEKQIEVK